VVLAGHYSGAEIVPEADALTPWLNDAGRLEFALLLGIAHNLHKAYGPQALTRGTKAPM
jgi:hypothetical protein